MGLSIVIIANCEPHILKQTLDTILEQEYKEDYEVIVVRPLKRDDTLEMLEPLMQRFSRIRTTYRPDEPQYITECEVNIMLGVKAAKYDNVIMIPADFTLPNETWLDDISEKTKDMASQHLLLGNAFSGNAGIFKRQAHKNAVNRALKTWCHDRAFSCSDMKMKKGDKKLFTIAFSQKEYFNERLLRDVIFKQIDD